MKTPFTISVATPAQASLVARLFDLYRQFYGRKSDPEVALHFISERLRNQDSVIFLALAEEGTPVGFAQMYPLFSSVGAKRAWLLNDLYVSLEARRMKLGKSLVERCIDHGRQTDAGLVSLQTADDNYPAQRLYESLGFKKDERFLTYDFQIEHV